MVFVGIDQLLFVSIAALFALTTLLFACVCWQKSAQKDDLLGLDGLVKITNPDENVNHMPPLTNSVSVTIQSSTSLNSESRSDISSKRTRPSGGNNSNRSLPDIPRPLELGNDIDDANSDIYAQPITQNYVGSETLNTEAAARPSLSQQSSLSQADGPYSRLKTEHPYDKLKKAEHPYANIQTLEDCSDREESSNVTDSNNVEVASTSVGQRGGAGVVDGPVAPPRSRRTSSQCSLPASSTSDIPAAVAVAGRIAASQDLPYMTPPPIQQNFSGDSQDSSKGYTSISVREPLANILAQTSITHRITRRQELTDHYAVVSDDSDEMYAAIEDPTQLYTSGSDTYAQIQPAATSQVEPKPVAVPGTSGSDTVDSLKSPAPQPPSVDSLRQVAQVHSRQASSSSCTSSVANLGSPKPEKRQANSPLPPRPAVSPEPRGSTSSSIMRNLEDMYAKVQKTGKKKREQNDDVERRLSGLEQQSRRSSVQNTSYENGPRNRPSLDAAFGRKSWSSRESVDHVFREFRELNSNVIEMPEVTSEHCYETLKNKGRPKNHDNDVLTGQIYENSGPDSLLSNDPGYEVLHKTSNNPPSDCDPNYEVLKPTNEKRKSSTSKGLYSTINKVRPDPGYESVKPPEHLIDEPNYESMPSDESNYASVAGGRSRAESDIDPNYEIVRRNDPNYESVKYYKRKDPPYERLHDDDSSNANVSSDLDDSSKNGKVNHLSTDSDDTSGDLISDNVTNRNVPELVESSQRCTNQQIQVNSCTVPGRRGSGIIEETIYKI